MSSAISLTWFDESEAGEIDRPELTVRIRGASAEIDALVQEQGDLSSPRMTYGIMMRAPPVFSPGSATWPSSIPKGVLRLGRRRIGLTL